MVCDCTMLVTHWCFIFTLALVLKVFTPKPSIILKLRGNALSEEPTKPYAQAQVCWLRNPRMCHAPMKPAASHCQVLVWWHVLGRGILGHLGWKIRVCCYRLNRIFRLLCRIWWQILEHLERCLPNRVIQPQLRTAQIQASSARGLGGTWLWCIAPWMRMAESIHVLLSLGHAPRARECVHGQSGLVFLWNGSLRAMLAHVDLLLRSRRCGLLLHLHLSLEFAFWISMVSFKVSIFIILRKRIIFFFFI